MRDRIFVLYDPIAPRLSPMLAKEIGLVESVILLQIEFWISVRPHVRDGKKWTYQTLRDLHNVFSFWSEDTINRGIHSLIELGLIEQTTKYNVRKGDRTRWFTINVQACAELTSVYTLDADPTISQFETTFSQFETALPESSTEKESQAETASEYVYVNGQYVGQSDDFFADLAGPDPNPKAERNLLDVDKEKPIKSVPIPESAYHDMYALCFMAETVEEIKGLNSTQRGRVASVLGQLRNADADFNRIRDFKTWWSGHWQSRSRDNGQYTPPRPEQVTEYWYVAMKAVRPKEDIQNQEQQPKQSGPTLADMEKAMSLRRNGGT